VELDDELAVLDEELGTEDSVRQRKCIAPFRE